MIIDVARLDPAGDGFVGEDSPTVLDLEGDPFASPAGPIQYDVRAQVVSHELVVTGTLRAPLRFRCSRCSEPFPRTVEETAFAAARDVTDATEFVDLTPEIRESILLAFPSYPVCRDDCRGLCAQCGVNLNEAPCDCKPPADARWGALDKLGL